MKKKGLPEINELVLVTVTRVTPFAAWCALNEYEAEGMIHISEVAGKVVYDIRNFVKEGKQYVARVLRIDRENNHINLSLKRVSNAEKKEKMNEFRRRQRSEKILEKVAEELQTTLHDVYENLGMPLESKFGDMFFAFETTHKSPEKALNLKIPEKYVNALINVLNKVFKEKEITIKAEILLRSYSKNGAEIIKQMLTSLEKSTGSEITYISAPKYLLKVTTKDYKSKEKELIENLEKLGKEAKLHDLEFTYKLLRQ